MGPAVRILFLADSHLGYDLPVRPRIERRRRGHDFLANYATALAPAFNDEVDLVVHGGDVFDRPGVVSSLAYQAFEPLTRIADRGIPVVIVPGNHERSSLPHLRFAAHPNIHVFGQPRTVVVTVRGVRVALAGFPYERRDVRTRFRSLLEATGWHEGLGDVHLLCVHHCVEGATVGPADYTFRSAPDVIRPREVPAAFAGLLSGHIHRHQVISRELGGRRLETPVLYPGSIERTSLAEIGEPKGFLLLGATPGEPLTWTFRPLPARPMYRRELGTEGLSAAELEAAIGAIVGSVEPDAVLSIQLTSPLDESQRRLMTAANLRALAPATMNLDVRPAGGFRRPPAD
ncbi:MAG: metallophosphoesterase [Gemmatimonadales bacterium]|nr:metallophosphoesterase [Gemmatimonadales bacterium]